MRSNHAPLRQGEVWLFDPDPVRSREIGKKNRSCIIISCDFFNKSESGIVIIVPITSKEKGIFSHVKIEPPHGGLEVVSFAMCEQIRAISAERLVKRLGILQSASIQLIHEWILDLIRFE